MSIRVLLRTPLLHSLPKPGPDAAGGPMTSRVTAIFLHRRTHFTVCAGLALLLATPSPSQCDTTDSVPASSLSRTFRNLPLPSSLPSGGGDNDPMSALIDKYSPMLSQITFGSVLGYCSGYASKQISKQVSIYIGVGFMGLQALGYYGYIDVNWAKVKQDSINVMDADHDGKLTVKDLKIWWGKLRHVCEYNLPGGGGFGAGFMMGLMA